MDNNTEPNVTQVSVNTNTEPGYRQHIHKESGVPYNQIKLTEDTKIKDATMNALINPNTKGDNSGINTELVKQGIDDAANEILNQSDDDDQVEQNEGDIFSEENDIPGDELFTQSLFGSDPFMQPNAQDPAAAPFASDPLFDLNDIPMDLPADDQEAPAESTGETADDQFLDNPLGDLLPPDEPASDESDQ